MDIPTGNQLPRNMRQDDEKPTAKRGYAFLSHDEKWRYHTHVYAFRLVYLDAPETQHYWDGDPDGEFFDPVLIANEVARLQAQKERQDGGKARRASTANDPRNDPVVQAQRRAWCKLKGYPSWEACLDDMWQDAQNHPNQDGEPNVLGALHRSGFAGFCADWRDRLIRNQMAARQERRP